MLRLTELAHQICRQTLQPGDVAIDATAGNGHDTLFLAETVGPAGRVFAFDIQPEALEQTRQQLETLNDERVTLIAGSHADMGNLIPAGHHGNVKAIVFNLGYLPGGNKQITTQTGTTLRALEAACRLVADSGLISIVAYPGHVAGSAETKAVEQFLQHKEQEGWNLQKFPEEAANESTPKLFVLSRQG